MAKKANSTKWRGLVAVSATLMSLSFAVSAIAEANVTYVDEALNTKSQTIQTVETEGEDLWGFKSDYKTAKEFVDANKTFAQDVEANGAVLLKNEKNTLPLKSDQKAVTLVGKAAYANVYGGQMGSGAANNAKYGDDYAQTSLTKALTSNGFKVNERMSNAYIVDTDKNGNPSYRSVSSLSGSFGMVSSEDYVNKGWGYNINEVTQAELEAKDKGVTTTSFGEYSTSIVVLGRINSEGRDYIPGEKGVKDGGAGQTNQGAKDPLGLSDAERDMIEMAKKNSDRVVVLINSNSPMEIPEVANDEGVDAILWIGTPGCYGMDAVAKILDGTVNPSGKLPDTYAYDISASPAAQNWDIFDYANLDDIATKHSDGSSSITTINDGSGKATPNEVDAQNLRASAYTVYQEGIYVGYKYYETRYYDSIVNKNFNASDKAGAKDGASAWNYSDEVLYTFGYGLSYTQFEQTLKSVSVDKAAKTVTATVEVKNTGSVNGKDAVELYASVPYTDYDKANGVEKSAVQLLDYEKVEVPAGQTKTVTITADLTDLASYDSKNAGTYILDAGTYYFTVGNGSHEAMNNVLAAQGYTTSNGMDANGNSENVRKWDHGNLDTTSFATSANGTKITNQLDNADLNYYIENAVTYLTRSDWKGTFPKAYTGLSANEKMIHELRNRTYEISKNDQVTTVWGVDKKDESLTLAAMKGLDFNDDRWESFLDQIPFEEALHIIAVGGNSTWTIEAIQNPFAKQADGPNGYSSFGIGQWTAEGSPYDMTEEDEFYGYRLNTTPNAPVLAATFDKGILEEYGRQLGNMSLWTGGPSIWAGGANLHRAPYEGRTHEYFSEDPILSAYSLLGMTSKAFEYGCLVGPKHFAFNAIEYNRYGLSEYMTEQCAREGELRCFQKAFESGKCLAVMTAFNRIGCSYINGHVGLMQNILRGEWGFKGLATTDMVNGDYLFGPVETIMGGITMMANGSGANADLKAAWVYAEADNLKNDAKFNAQLRENMHYQWYAYAHSNILNGMNQNTIIVQNMTWWRATILGLEIGFAVLTVAAAGMYVWNVIKERKEG